MIDDLDQVFIDDIRCELDRYWIVGKLKDFLNTPKEGESLLISPLTIHELVLDGENLTASYSYDVLDERTVLPLMFYVLAYKPTFIEQSLPETTHGKGWNQIVHPLLRVLRRYSPNIEFSARQDFGGLVIEQQAPQTFLRDYFAPLLDFVEWLSYFVCEQCGSTEDLHFTRHKFKVLCSQCLEK